MLITIPQFTLPAENLADGDYTLRQWYNVGFIDSSGQAVAPGTATSGTQLRSGATVSGGFITFDPLSVYSTLDAQTPAPQSIQINSQVFKGNSGLPIFPFNQSACPASWIVPDDLGASISFEEWTLANQRIVLTNPPQTFYTAASADALIAAAEAQTAVNQDYVISSYASFAAAITAVTVTGGTLVINQATTSIANNSVPANITLRFTRKGSITISTGTTLTILGPVEADAVKIFYNAVSGQGAISFAGNSSILHYLPEWWGYLANGLTGSAAANQLALNACIASMPATQPGYSGGILTIPPGLSYTTGTIITDQQVHIIGSGGPGVLGSTITSSSILASTTNSPVIKYANSSNLYSFRARLENLTILGSVSAGSSQHGVWVDNNGILVNNVGIEKTGGHGLYLTKSSSGGYSNMEISSNAGDGIRVNYKASADAGAGCHNNIFLRNSITAAQQTGVHIMHGDGNVFFGLDTEQNTGRGFWFEYPGGGGEARFNQVFGYWSENNGLPDEFDGPTQNNYLGYVHNSSGAPIVNSTGIGNRFDDAPAYGTPQTFRIPRLIVGPDGGQYASAPEGLYISDGNLNFPSSAPRVRWGVSAGGVVTLAQLGVSSSTNIQILDSTGLAAGSLTLGPADVSHPSLMASGANLAARLGNDSAFTGFTAKNLIVANTGLLRVTPKTSDTWGAAISLDVTISNHDITAVFATSATSTITPTGAGTAGDWIFINTINGAGGSVVVTFASTFHSSGTQTTQASRFSSIAFRSTGTVWVEQYRTTDLT